MPPTLKDSKNGKVSKDRGTSRLPGQARKPVLQGHTGMITHIPEECRQQRPSGPHTAFNRVLILSSGLVFEM